MGDLRNTYKVLFGKSGRKGKLDAGVRKTGY
jgi:hypothetical protein